MAAEQDKTNGEAPELGYETTVEDPEDIAQRSRLRELFEARRQVQEDRRRIADARIRDPARHQRLRGLLRASLEVYFRELEPLMTDRYPAQGLKHWYDAELGWARWVPTPAVREQLDDQLDREHKDYPPSASVDPITQRFVGLRSILNTEKDLAVSFDVKVAAARGQTRTLAATQEVEIPFRVLDTAYRHSNAFLGSIGLEATDSDDTDSYEQKFTDLH